MNVNGLEREAGAPARVAVPMAEGRFAGHFGGAREFLLVDGSAGGGALHQERLCPAPPHARGAYPRWLAGQGVDAVVAGAIGERALIMLADAGIRVFMAGGDGTPSALAAACLRGALAEATLGNSGCDHSHGHDHDHDHDHGHGHGHGHGGEGCSHDGAADL